MTHLKVTYEGKTYPVLNIDDRGVTMLNTDTGELFYRHLVQVRVEKDLCATYKRDLEPFSDRF